VRGRVDKIVAKIVEKVESKAKADTGRHYDENTDFGA
jgi:hypothetical protein